MGEKGECGIPYLTAGSKIFPHFGKMFRGHLKSLNELRLLDMSFVVPTNGEVETYSINVKDTNVKKIFPYTMLNAQCMALLSRLLHSSLHHLLELPDGHDPNYLARAAWQQIEHHFSGSSHTAKATLKRRFHNLEPSPDPEVTYNLLLEINSECSIMGCRFSDEDMCLKFSDLINLSNSAAYLPITLMLSNTTSCTIQRMWHDVQVIYNQLLLNTPTHVPAMTAHTGNWQQDNNSVTAHAHTGHLQKCMWCGSLGHKLTHCYSRDIDNMYKYPLSTWEGKGPPDHVKLKFNTNQPQNPAMILIHNQKARSESANVASVSTRAHPIWTPASALASTSPAGSSSTIPDKWRSSCDISHPW
jgi:hypothetical protein